MKNHECWKQCHCGKWYDGRHGAAYCCAPSKRFFLSDFAVTIVIVLLLTPVAGFSQVYLEDLDHHPKTSPYLDSIGIPAVINQSTGQYGHYTFKDQDNQQITIEIDNDQINYSLEQGGSGSVNLQNYLNRIEARGTDICVVGTSNCIDAGTIYLDNTDNQQFDSITFDGAILTHYLEGAPAHSVNIEQLEEDPIFLAHVASTITASDIQSWRDHVLADQDLSSTNEIQTLTPSRPVPTRLRLDGSVLPDGPFDIEVLIPGMVVVQGQGAGTGTDDQFISRLEDSLFIEDGNAVYLGDLRQTQEECETITVTSATMSSPVTLSSNIEQLDIELNGWGATYVTAPPTHANEVQINNQNIIFSNEAVLHNYSVRVCSE